MSTDQDPGDRPSDTETAQLPDGGAVRGGPSPQPEPDFGQVEGARDPHEDYGQPADGANANLTAGGAVADRLPPEAVKESGDDLAIDPTGQEGGS
jgi:hypothetical protein